MICQFYYNNSIEDDLESVKYKVTELFKLNEKIQKELDQIKEIAYCEFWVQEIVFSGRCKDGGYYYVPLSDCIDYLFLA